MKQTGVVPAEHYSHDHLNEQRDVPVDAAITNKWRETFKKTQEEHESAGEKIVWVIIDGFLMYWNQVRFLSIDSDNSRLHSTVS
jgi:nicotinamide/nicotinate riboside kinase